MSGIKTVQNSIKKIYEKNKSNRLNKTRWFTEYKTHCECFICGENHIATLEFHHMNPEEKDTNISDMMRCAYSYKNLFKELEKCVCLCANCHKKLHYHNEKFL